MFMRITSYKSDRSRLDEADAQVESVRSILNGTKGLRYAAVGRDDDGNAAVMAIWDSEESARAAEDTVAKAWASLGDMIVSPPKRQEFRTAFHLAGTV